MRMAKTKRRVLLLISCWALLQYYLHSLSLIPSLTIDEEIQVPQEQSQIPRILHFLWPNKDFSFGPDDPHDVEQRRTLELVQRIKNNNPGWRIQIWTDDDCHVLMKQHFPHYYSQWKELSPQLKMWDAVRPCILWVHGGIYLDHDVDCDEGVKFDDWIQLTTTLLLREPTHSRQKLGNHFMGSSPHHDIWKLYLDNIWKDTVQNYSVVRHTGPLQLYPTYQQYIAGEEHRDFIRLLQLNEFENPGECERLTGNHTFCTLHPHCIHMHTISPAELAGQDDNADLQIRQYQQRIALQHNYTTVPWACTRFQQFIDSTNNNSRPVIFIHIPKTGGTSIEHAMGYQRSCHATAVDYQECDSGKFNTAFKFAALRNPLERIVSLYNYALDGGNGGKQDLLKYAWVKGLNFPSFVDALTSRHEFNFAPQTHFVLNNKSELLVNELICAETLESHWKSLQAVEPTLEKFGALPSMRLRAATTNNGISVHQVDDTTKRRLQEYYHGDFKLWEEHCKHRKV